MLYKHLYNSKMLPDLSANIINSLKCSWLPITDFMHRTG